MTVDIFCNGERALAHWIIDAWHCGTCGKVVKVVW